MERWQALSKDQAKYLWWHKQRLENAFKCSIQCFICILISLGFMAQAERTSHVVNDDDDKMI